jgi:signal transduction histidine kinase
MSPGIRVASFSHNQLGKTRPVAAFALAVLLPLASACAIADSEALQSIPFSLYYISIACVALLGGIYPSLLAAALCVVFRNSLVLPGHWQAFDAGDFVRIPSLFAQAILVSVLNIRQRRTSERLQEALETLGERTSTLESRSDALIDSLRVGECASWTADMAVNGPPVWYAGSYPIFGRPFSELVTLDSFLSIMHDEDRQLVLNARASMRDGLEPVTCEYRVLWPDGDTHVLELRGTRVAGPGCIWRGVTVDITRRKLAEATLIKQEKLAAMGRLASTVAHEINNPLASVTNLLYLATSEPSLTPAVRNYISTAERELARLADITRLTLGFVRNSSVSRVIEIASVVEEVLSIFRHRFEIRSIQIERFIDPGVCVFIAPHELRQILANLISNAAEALTLPAPRIAIHIFRDGANASLLLEDNGIGILPNTLEHIFEPFFTTKPDIGTGIGLWVTREIVEKNGGRMSAVSGDLPNGMRTRFQIDLPLATAGAAFSKSRRDIPIAS